MQLRQLARACGVAAAIAAASLPLGAAAAPFTITSTGVVGSGTGVGGADLAGDRYTILLAFDGAGGVVGGGTAGTQGGVTGQATAIVGGVTTRSSVTADYGGLVDEQTTMLFAQLVGVDALGSFSDAAIMLSSLAGRLPPDLVHSFIYQAQPGDSGSDIYLATDASGLPILGFSGTPDTVKVAIATPVPEPSTLGLLAMGLLWLALLLRRPLAVPRPR